MKRLKYRHLFNGRCYPLNAAFLSFVFLSPIACIPALLLKNSSFLLLMPVIPAIALIVCFCIAQHLRKDEREIIANTTEPVWHPLKDAVRAKIIEKYSVTQYSFGKMLLGSFGAAAIVSVCGFFLCRSSGIGYDNPVLLTTIIPFGTAGIAMIALYLNKSLSKKWLNIYDSAECTIVPVARSYSVKHRYGTSHYAVFYQSDGRYVLDVDPTEQDAVSLIIIRYRGALTWLPVMADSMDAFL